MQSIAGSLSVYIERRMARILLLGIISGFPWVLIGSALSLWLKEDGLSRSTIGWAGLIFGVYAINFLWAPLIDRDPGALADGQTGTSPRLDRHPSGCDPGVPRRVERGRAGGEPDRSHRHRARHRHRVGNPGHHHRCAPDRADRRGGRRIHGGGGGHRGGRLVDGIQARRGGRAGDRGSVPARRGRGLLAGHLSRARDRGRSLQHRTGVRTRAASGGAYRRSGEGRESGRLALRPLRPTRPRRPPGSPAPWPAR